MTSSAQPLLVDRPGKTLRELALEKLREAILEGHFQPGERLIERDLCSQLGVSRTIVREVLRHLESEGLVATLPNRGPIVARTTAAEAQQIYEIRGILEGIAARACAETPDKGFVDALEHRLSNIQAAYAGHQMAQVLFETTEFYRVLFSASGRDIAWGIVNSITARINHLRSMTIKTPGRAAEGPQQMRRIVDAIRAGDGEAAYHAAHAHVANASMIAQSLLGNLPKEE